MANSQQGALYPSENNLYSGGTSCRVLSILLLALEAITALCTNYSALSRKSVVGKATRLTTLLIKTCQQATCVLSMCAGTPLSTFPTPNPHPIPTGGSVSMRAGRHTCGTKRKQAETPFMKLPSFVLLDAGTGGCLWLPGASLSLTH